MYSDNDLEEAVAAGVIPRDTVDAFRLRIADERHLPRIDEEHYRFLDGNNDGFVAFGSILLMAGLGSLGYLANHVMAGLAVAASAWALAEYFVAIRRLTLTGILLSFAFFGGVVATLALALYATEPDWGPKGFAAAGALIFAVAAGASWLFWKRFTTPVTVSFVALSAALVVIALVVALVGDGNYFSLARIAYPVALACGLGVFAYAMWWDLSDRHRVTQRHEVAFWVHGVAGTLIAQAVFYLVGATGGMFMPVSSGQVIVVILVFAVFALVALAIDRRALLFSSSTPLLYALMGMFMQAGAYQSAMGWAALIVGAALLSLSAFWRPARAKLVPLLGSLSNRLPPVDGLFEHDEPEEY
jgi:hypothetical protein